MDDEMAPPDVSFWGMVVKPGKKSKTTIPAEVQLHVSTVRISETYYARSQACRLAAALLFAAMLRPRFSCDE